MKGFYINLDKRKDRKEYFTKMVEKCTLFSQLERLPAIEMPNGAIWLWIITY
jgi:hypothetical protein